MIERGNIFDHPVKNDQRTYDNFTKTRNIRKIATGQGDDYTTGCLLHHVYYKSYFKKICNRF